MAEQNTDINAEFKAFTDDMKGRFEALKDQKLVDQKQIKEALEKLGDLGPELEAFKSRLSRIELKGNRRGAAGESGAPPMSLGAALVGSEFYKESVERRQQLRTDRVRVPGGLKAMTTESGYGGDAIDPVRRDGIIEIPTRPLRLLDLFPRMNWPNGSIQFVRETAFHELYSLVKTQAASGQKVITVENTYGFYPGQVIKIAPGTGQEETRTIDTGGVSHANKTLTVTINLSNTHAVGVEVVSDTFVFTPETQLKPLAQLKTELVTGAAKTIAHGIPISKQLARDAAALMQYIDRRLPAGVQLNMERQLLYGNGGNEQLDGVFKSGSGIQTYSWSAGQSGDTRRDAVRRAIALATLAFYPTDAVVLHPTDWTNIELEKATNGHYLNMGNGSTSPWRVPVVESPVIAQGTSLTGSFSQAGMIYDIDEVDVALYDQHADYPLRNMVLALAEARLYFALERPASMVKVTFDSAPA